MSDFQVGDVVEYIGGDYLLDSADLAGRSYSIIDIEVDGPPFEEDEELSAEVWILLDLSGDDDTHYAHYWVPDFQIRESKPLPKEQRIINKIKEMDSRRKQLGYRW